MIKGTRPQLQTCLLGSFQLIAALGPRLAMTAIEGASKLLSSEGKSGRMKAESTAAERDVFREIPLRYAGKCAAY